MESLSSRTLTPERGEAADLPPLSPGAAGSWPAPEKRPAHGARWDHGATAAGGLTLCLALLFTLWFAHLSLQRHAAFASNAEDLGFHTQVVWNTLQGRPFTMSLYLDMVVQTDIDPATLKRPDSLLAFHVEPLLLPLSLLFRWWPGAETLLIVQAIGAAAAAIPIHRLAVRALHRAWAGPAFAAVYLLAPPLHWALLSDFHTIVIGATALAFLYDFALAEGADVGFWLAGLVALAAREEVGLLVAPIALYRAARGPRRLSGALLATVALGWIAICGLVILPAHGGGSSPFLGRYADLGGTPGEILRTLLAEPGRVIALIERPVARHFLAGLVAMTGGLWLFALLAIVPAGPILALNLLSAWPWMAAGEAHYSVLVVPSFVVGSILGAGWLARQFARVRLPGRVLMTVWAVGAAVLWSRVDGLTPLNSSYNPPEPGAHDRLFSRFAEQIPPDAAVSASSGLYPHLSTRRAIYLYPTVRDAEYIVLDVTGTAFPSSPGDQYQRVQSLLASETFGVVDAADGYLLLRRGGGLADPPAEFWSFSRGEDVTGGPIPAGQPIPVRLLWREESNGPRRQVRAATEWVAGRAPIDWDLLTVVARYPGGTRDLAAESAAVWWLRRHPPAPGQRFRIDHPSFPAGIVTAIEYGLTGGPIESLPLGSGEWGEG